MQNHPQNKFIKRLMVNIPLHPQSFLTIHKATEVISRAFQLVNSNFEWVLLDKPVDGTLILFTAQPGQQQLPEDGYGWMDDEVRKRFTLENGLEIQTLSRSLGFGPSDAFCTWKRMRFVITQNPELQLIHYIKSPSNAKVVAGMAVALPRGVVNPAKTVIRQTPLVKVVAEEFEEEGDEADLQFARLLALERYKRNHLLMDKVFSPQTKLERVQFGIKTSPELVQKEIEKMEAEIKEIKADFEKEISEYKMRSERDWKEIMFNKE
jgi:hypothetical protein